MGSGVSSHLAPRTNKTAKKNRRTMAKSDTKSYHQLIVDKYDKNKDGVLDKGEVKAMCEHIMAEISPDLGGVTDEDVEMVMRLGGEDVKETIAPDDVPHALSLVLAMKKEKVHISELFDRHDVDKKGKMAASEIKELLTEVNDGIIPSKSDIDHVMDKCTLTEDGCVTKDQIRAAIAAWYFLVDENDMPGTEEEARAMGYTEAQIEHFKHELEEEAAIEAQIDAVMEKEAAEAAVEAAAETPKEAPNEAPAAPAEAAAADAPAAEAAPAAAE